jgi:hypothetical protein
VATKQESYGTPTWPVFAGHANVRVEGQVTGAVPVMPLMVIGTCDPELLRVAEPVTSQLPIAVVEKVPDPTVTVSVVPEAVKL